LKKKSLDNISKYLSYILRHNPKEIISKLNKESNYSVIDKEGFVFVNDLIEVLDIDFQILLKIVHTDTKKRYSFNEDKTKLRANQGHSIKDIDISFKEKKPQNCLYHGTNSEFVESILINGLTSQSRQYVHLTDSLEIAYEVGNRRLHTGTHTVIFIIDTKKMIEDGSKFYISENNVWLISEIPSKYLSLY